MANVFYNINYFNCISYYKIFNILFLHHHLPSSSSTPLLLLLLLLFLPLKLVSSISNSLKSFSSNVIQFLIKREIDSVEKRKVLSNVEKAGLLLKAEELGFTLFAIEKLWVVFQGGGVWV